MASQVTFEISDNVGVLTLNQPETKNALTEIMIHEMVDIFDQCSRDLSIRCLILRGAGGAFCSGGNFKDMQNRTGYAGGGPSHGWQSMIHQFQKIPRAFENLDIPIIAAIEGPAFGAGCDIAAMCDIRLAATNATFSETFINLGVISGDGGSWFLSRVLGYSRAAEMTYTGDVIDANTAASWGLVSRVVAIDSLLSEARAMAGRIARKPPLSLRMAKRLLRQASQNGLQNSLELAAAMQGVALHTRDQQEAVRAVVERRPGTFTGE